MAAVEQLQPRTKRESARRLSEMVRKTTASGRLKAVVVVSLHDLAGLRDEDSVFVAQEAFHHLSQGCRQFVVEGGDVVVLMGRVDQRRLAAFESAVRTALTDRLEARGAGPLPETAVTLYTLPAQMVDVLIALGQGDREQAEDIAARFSLADCLAGALDDDAVFEASRRQALLQFEGNRRLVRGHELYASIDYLKQNRLLGFDLSGAAEIDILGRVLDGIMLSVVRRLEQALVPDCIHLNLRLETLLSDRFRLFLEGADDGLLADLRIEVALDDALRDWSGFEHARDMLRNADIPVGIDRIGLAAVPHLQPDRLDADFIKVVWDAALVGSRNPAVSEALSALCAVYSDRMVVLSRCDSATALRFGRTLGVEVFQGAYIDAMLGRKMTEFCHSSRPPNDRRCAVCQWAPKEALANGCGFHLRAGKTL